MNLLSLLYSRLKSCFLRNKVLTVLFIVGSVIHTLSIIYCYGNLLPNITNRTSTSTERHSYVLDFDSQYPTIAEVQKLVENPLISACYASTDEEIGTWVGPQKVLRLSGRIEFEANNEVVVPALSTVAVGDKIEIGEELFSVIGSASGIYKTYMISADDFSRLGFENKITTLHITSATSLSATTKEIIAILSETFPYATYLSGDAIVLAVADRKDTEFYAILITIATIMSIIAQSFLLAYLAKEMKGYNVVLMTVGATHGEIILFTVVEIMIVCLCPTLISCLLHKIVYGAFETLNITKGIVYTCTDYLTITVSLLLLSMLIMLPIGIGSVRKSPIASRKRLD